jgi:hypothetical protein
MPQITRTWLAFAALGAGLIHLALVVGAPAPLAITLVLLGLVEFSWGIITLARDDVVLPRLARVVAIAPVILWSLLVVVSMLLAADDIVASLTLVPMSIALIFQVFIALVITRHLRRASTTDDGTVDAAAAPTAPTAGRYLLALTVGALLVGGLTTPALAATEAGRYAQPHGDHDPGFVPAPGGDDPLADLDLPGHDAH